MAGMGGVRNGFEGWLIWESVGGARDHGYRRVSLNFAPFAALLAPEGELTRAQHIQAATLRRFQGRVPLDNLVHLKPKVFPEGRRRLRGYGRPRGPPRRAAGAPPRPGAPSGCGAPAAAVSP